MKGRKNFRAYAIVWGVATLLFLALLVQNVGDARKINYCGLVRGMTQKLVKEEMEGHPDDELITYLDQIIYDLETGEGEYNLTKTRSKEFQDSLVELNIVWEEVKQEIEVVRENPAETEKLYELSQVHFDLADEMVQSAGKNADFKLHLSIGVYCIYLLISAIHFFLSKRRSQEKLEKSYSYDRLTGLLSRRGFEEEAEAILRKANNRQYVIVEFDVVNFKGINRAFGYEQGDQMLQNIASAVEKWKDNKAVCARIDADDFVVLYEQKEFLVSELEKQLLKAVGSQKELTVYGDVSFTFGAYEIDDAHEHIKVIMDKANTAHKTAKQSEDCHVLWYDEELIEKIEQEKAYIERMGQGILGEEFKMYLQTKIDLSTLHPVGAEALVRWDIPGKGLIYPDEFIPLFEKNGSIVKLDYYMLEKACEHLRERMERGEQTFTISVNFSRVTLYQEKLYDTVVSIVDRYGLPHSCIEIEITESAFNEVADTVLHTLRRLMEAEFHISMDDFGAGYSNLNMLTYIPIEILKLDRAFMREMEANKKTRGVVACIIDIAHAMGIKVVCEGIEKEEQIRALKQMGCEFGQGYFFSKPIPEEEFANIYKNFYIAEDLDVAHEVAVDPNLLDWQKVTGNDDELEEAFLTTYPGLLSLRDEQHKIVYLNENFRSWVREYTDVDPIGKTNVELAELVPQNVADTFMQCHDGSMELQKDADNKVGLKKVIEFHAQPGCPEETQYLDVLKYWITLKGEPYIFTIAYDISRLYKENMWNFQSSMTDGLTGARNRSYIKAEISQYEGHNAVMFNLDNFKRVNEEAGYGAGDEILKEFVNLIHEHMPSLLVMIRLDGDEFLAIFKNELERDELYRRLEELRKLYEQTHAQYSYLSFSMAVDVIGTQLDDTLNRLDKQMRIDKKRRER